MCFECFLFVLIFLSTLTENFQNRFATVTGLLLLVEILGITNSFSEQYKNERILIPKKKKNFVITKFSIFNPFFLFVSFRNIKLFWHHNFTYTSKFHINSLLFSFFSKLLNFCFRFFCSFCS